MGTMTQEVWADADPIRLEALRAAVQIRTASMSTPESVLKDARIYEAYLKGEEHEPAQSSSNPGT